MARITEVKIHSLFGGISPSALLGPEGFYSEAYNIDPFMPSNTTSTYLKRGGLLGPGQTYQSFGSAQEQIEGNLVKHIIVPDTKITNQFVFYFSDGDSSSKILASNTSFAMQTADEAAAPNTLPRVVANLNGRGAAFFAHALSTSTGGNGDLLGALYYKNGTQIGRYGPIGSASGANFRDAWIGDIYDGISPMFWHKWDGDLYIGNGQATPGSIAKITVSGSESTISTTSTFRLPPNFEINDIDSFNKYLLFAGHQTPTAETIVKTGEAGIFVWDTVSERWDDFIPLPDARCTAIQKVNGVPFAFSGGTDTRISILHPLQSKYTEVDHIPSIRPPHHGMTDAIGELLVFAPDGTDLAIPDQNQSRATIWAYGSTNTKFPKALHNIIRAPIGGAEFGASDRVGAMKFVQQIGTAVAPRLLFGYRDTAAANVGKLARAGGTSQTAFYRSPMISFNSRFRIKKVKFQFDQVIGTGTSTITPSFQIEHQSTQVTLTAINNTNFNGARRADLITDIVTTTDAFLQLEWSGTGTSLLRIILPIIIEIELLDRFQ